MIDKHEDNKRPHQFGEAPELQDTPEDRLTALENVVIGLLGQVSKYHPDYTLEWFDGLSASRQAQPFPPVSGGARSGYEPKTSYVEQTKEHTASGKK